MHKNCDHSLNILSKKIGIGYWILRSECIRHPQQWGTLLRWGTHPCGAQGRSDKGKPGNGDEGGGWVAHLTAHAVADAVSLLVRVVAGLWHHGTRTANPHAIADAVSLLVHVVRGRFYGLVGVLSCGSTAVKTSRPRRSTEEEGPRATIRCPWHHGATSVTSRPWRSAEEEAPDAIVSVAAWMGRNGG
jgi:hypothetical protein